MILPKIISDLLKAQTNFDSIAYANCFSEEAVVFDEGKTHKGRTEIKRWNEKTNANYKVLLEPIDYSVEDKTSILKTRVSGTFDGSPIVLKYNFELKDGHITRLKITS